MTTTSHSHHIAARREHGVTMIELMVGLTIMAFLLASGAPAFSEWIRNAKIRGEAESILTGLQHARMEAVRRNTPVSFQLTDTLDNNCALSTSGQNWVVNLASGGSPAGQCATAISDATAPNILQTSSAATGSTSITVAMSPQPQTTVTFNGFGQQTSSTTPTTVTIDVTSPQSACVAPQQGGTSRCLRITVSPAGLPRMCDPSTSGC